MKALVIYDTLFGNTRQVAESIAAGLSEQYQVTMLPASDVTELDGDLDLLVIGGPTHRHGLSNGMRDLLERIPNESLRNLRSAAFDTRYPGPGWVTGSAANRIARYLRRHKAHQVIEPESFFIAREKTETGETRNHQSERLEEGETNRATIWGQQIATPLVPVG